MVVEKNENVHFTELVGGPDLTANLTLQFN